MEDKKKLTDIEINKISDKQDDIFFEMLHEILNTDESNYNKADSILWLYQTGKREYYEFKMLLNRQKSIKRQKK